MNRLRYVLWDHHVRTIKCLFGYHDWKDVEDPAMVEGDDEWGMGYGRSIYATVISMSSVSVKRCSHCGKSC